jgi:hypothetical protein
MNFNEFNDNLPCVLDPEFEKQIMYFECALLNKVFSQDRLDEHLSFVMQDTLAVDASSALEYGSETRRKHDSEAIKNIFMAGQYNKHDQDFVFIGLFRNVDELVRQNQEQREELVALNRKMETLEAKLEVLVQVHNCKVQEQNMINQGGYL